MVAGTGGAGAKLVKRRRARLREAWLRVFVWMFIIVFALSVVGGLIAFVSPQKGSTP